MLIKVQLCYHKDVGLGVKAKTKIPKGVNVLYYYGEVHSTANAKKDDGVKHTHLLTFPGTGCSVDGSYDILFPSEPTADFTKAYTIPSPFMSLTNSSYGYKEANCKLVFEDKPCCYANDLYLDKTAWLVTTINVEENEELIWNYTFR